MPETKEKSKQLLKSLYQKSLRPLTSVGKVEALIFWICQEITFIDLSLFIHKRIKLLQVYSIHCYWKGWILSCKESVHYWLTKNLFLSRQHTASFFSVTTTCSIYEKKTREKMIFFKWRCNCGIGRIQLFDSFPEKWTLLIFERTFQTTLVYFMRMFVQLKPINWNTMFLSEMSTIFCDRLRCNRYHIPRSWWF